MWWILIPSILLNGVVIYVGWNLLRKNEWLEDFIVEIATYARSALMDMRALDTSGAFEADDDVGTTFTALRTIVEDYARFVGVEEDRVEEDRVEEAQVKINEKT